MDHEADGIRELDNLLPRWWVWLFNLSILFSFVYFAYYHIARFNANDHVILWTVYLASFFVAVFLVAWPTSRRLAIIPSVGLTAGLLGLMWHGAGPLSAQEYDQEMKIGNEIKAASIAKFEANIDSLTPSTDAAVVAQGNQIFSTYCAPCHRADGGGLVGPNLCDDYWIHGSNYVDNVRTIINGVPAKGMLTWRGILNPDQIKAVGSYIYTLRGTHPPNPKPAENTVQAPTGPSEFE